MSAIRRDVMSRLGRPFYQGDTLDVAKKLLGKVLVRVVRGKRFAGRIVEVEVYRGAGDPASHAYRGLTERNRVMFGEPGHAYVYFTMGMHWCLNVTTEAPGKAGAVLIRALEPTEGLEAMKRERGRRTVGELTNGPAKLTEAMSIDGRLNGEDLTTSERLFVESGKKAGSVGTSSRIGINRGTEFEWRFFIKGNPFVSRGRPSRTRAQNP
ncbi:MAG: DNA-3-methyladenine glycosylase [Nitrososphaerales archaeon]|nr:DNA-3-methyladenine glycosylase [Nitrososphaerales archaeon]